MAAVRFDFTKWNTITADSKTLATSMPGVFAAGDAIHGPNTVIEAIADGKKSAIMIDRFIRGESLDIKAESTLPQFYIAPSEKNDDDNGSNRRVECKCTSAKTRVSNFNEVEVSLSQDEARCEARRCLRCDLEFTQSIEENQPLKIDSKSSAGGKCEMITLTINGVDISVEEGTTVLEAAKMLGFPIPTLCHMEGLSPYGACRLCIVEIGEGPRTKIVTSCTYPVEEGLKVRTTTKRIARARKMIIELLLASCPQSKVIQDIAAKYEVKQQRFKQEYEDCILCGLCVRMCEEQMVC